MVKKPVISLIRNLIVLLLQKDAVIPDPQILKNTENGAETIVRYGSRIGTAADFHA